MFNLVEFLKIAAPTAGALVPLVIAASTFLGKVGVKGNAQLFITAGGGFVLAVCAMIAQVGFPHLFADYFALVVFGLVVGFGAVGVYETGLHIAGKAPVDEQRVG
jgi:hypothetical protein